MALALVVGAVLNVVAVMEAISCHTEQDELGHKRLLYAISVHNVTWQVHANSKQQQTSCLPSWSLWVVNPLLKTLELLGRRFPPKTLKERQQ